MNRNMDLAYILACSRARRDPVSPGSTDAEHPPPSFPPAIFDDDSAMPTSYSVGCPSSSTTVDGPIPTGVWNVGFETSSSTFQLPTGCDSSTTLPTAPLPPYNAITSADDRVVTVSGAPRRSTNRRVSTISDEEGGADRCCCSRRCRYKGCAVCCTRCLLVATSLKFILIAVTLTGICVVFVGISLGILNMVAGSGFLTLSVVFIGVGGMTVTFVGLIWRYAPSNHEPCHKLLRIDQMISGDTAHELNNNRPRFTRNQQWYGGIVYPEFNFGAPPPTYDASFIDRRPSHDDQVAASAPTTGTSRTGSDCRDVFAWPLQTVDVDDISPPSSRPPSYRSRASSRRHRLDLCHRQPPSSLADNATSPDDAEDASVTHRGCGAVLVVSRLELECASDSTGLPQQQQRNEKVDNVGLLVESQPPGHVSYLIDETRFSEL